MSEPKLWASEEPGAHLDWIEFVVPPEPSAEDEAPEYSRHVRANVSFLLSNWTCIYGAGCPSVLIKGVNTDTGCCQIGVHVNDAELKRVRGYVDQLTPEDADNWAAIRERWYRRDAGGDDDAKRKTMTRQGACIMHNRAGGPAGKSGCALHHLATRLGVHPAETKPDICWQIPIDYDEEYDDNAEVMRVLVSGSSGSNWGEPHWNKSSGHPGYWCTETPDAYVGRDPVYKSSEYELRKLMGDRVYEALCGELERVTPRWSMPGEVANGGHKMIPLMVLDRIQMWGKEKDKTKDYEEALDYLLDNNSSGQYNEALNSLNE